VFPVVALAVGPTAALARIVRVETLRVLAMDYMRTARSKRLPTHRLYVRHALPNLLTASLTIGGLLVGSLVAGTVLVENVFAWPGLGMTFVDSISQKDYPLVQGIVVVLGTGVLLINLLVDVLLAVLDPRSTIKEG
jgi:peptide/nickel transport system permease protein